MNKIYKFLSTNKLNILFTICLMIFNIGIIDKKIQNDTFFTIPTGIYILENGIDEIEPFTYHENLKYIKLRWAFDVVVAKIYNTFSFEGLYVFVIIISMLISVGLYNFLTNLNNNKTISFIITLAIMLGLKEYLVCRAQIISYLLFAIEGFLLEKLLQTQKKKYILFLTIISTLLVNFHSSVWLVFFLPFIPYFAEKLIYKLSTKKKIKFLNKFNIENINLKYLSITFVICLLSGLISPLGINPYTYIFKVMNGVSKKFIIELQPSKLLSTFPINIFIFFSILILFLKRIKIKLSDFFLILGFSIMSKLAVRNVFISIIFMAYPISRIINKIIKEYDKKLFFEKIDKFIEENIIINILIFVSIFEFTLYNYKDIKYQEYVDEKTYPVELVKFMYRNIDIDTAKVYAEFDISSYFEFSGIQTCLDSRTEVYCKEFSNVTILEDWYNLNYKEKNKVMDFIEKYDIKYLALYRTNSLADYLVYCKELYHDDYFVLYQVKKGEKND